MTRRSIRTAIAVAAILVLAGCGGGAADEDASADEYFGSSAEYSTYYLAPPVEAKWGAHGEIIAIDAAAGSITIRDAEALEVVDGVPEAEGVQKDRTFTLEGAALRCETEYGDGYAIPVTELVPGGYTVVWGSGSASEGIPTHVFFDNQRYCDPSH